MTSRQESTEPNDTVVGSERVPRSMASSDDEYERLKREHDLRTQEALAMGGADKLSKRRETGVLNARERVASLLDADTFVESGLFASSPRPELHGHIPADGKVTGFGLVAGRPVGVVANDFTVLGASSTRVNGRKIKHIKDTATTRGLPIVFLGESTGARMPDVMGAAGVGSGDNPTQYRRCRESPWAAAVLGHCYGSSAWYTALSDFAVMRRGAVLAVSSPKLTSMAIGQDVDPEQLGGWRVHADVSGLVDDVTATDEDAIALIKRFLGYMPGNQCELPPTSNAHVGPPGDPEENIRSVLPLGRRAVYDVRKVIETIVDQGSLFELKRRFGRSIVTGLARLEGSVVGLIANNPLVQGGAIDADACTKATSFLVLCDTFNIPIVFLVDQPGFLIGQEGERRAVIGKVMNWMNALSLCTVPKISIVMRKTYGQAVLNMGGGGNADEVCAWTTAEVSFMDPEFAVRIVYNITRESDPDLFDERLQEMSKSTSAYQMAEPYLAHAVIQPWETRPYLTRSLRFHQNRLGGGVGQHLLASWPTSIV